MIDATSSGAPIKWLYWSPLVAGDGSPKAISPPAPTAHGQTYPSAPGIVHYTGKADLYPSGTLTGTLDVRWDPDPPAAPAQPHWSVANASVASSSATSHGTTLYASWAKTVADALSGVYRFRVQVAETPTFGTTLADRTVAAGQNEDLLNHTETFTSADGIRYGHSYYFRVAAIDRAGNQGAWSPPSNEMDVTDRVVGPQVVHAPVVTAFYGQDAAVSIDAECSGSGACDARLFYRRTPKSSVAVLHDGGWTQAPLTVVETDELAPGMTRGWTGVLPGSAMDTVGLDYFVEVEDTTAITHHPGGSFAGIPGVTGVQPARLGYYHVHVVSPPLVAHTPPPFAVDRTAVPLQLTATCSRPSCSADVFYRTTTGPVTDEILTSVPSWPRAAMTATPGTSLDKAGKLYTFTGEVPASYVDTRGVDYVFRVTDGETTTWWPGTTYQGYYVPTDGVRTGYHHVHVLEQPHPVHAPVTTAPYNQPISVDATANCVAHGCTATLYYRTAGPGALSNAAFATTPMTVTVTASSGSGDAVTLHGVIPAANATTQGVDYFFSITDGATTAWWPGTSDVDGYVPVAGVRVLYQHVRVLDPPHIVHAPQPTTKHGQPTPVTATVTCAPASCPVTLYYRVVGAPAFSSTPMTQVGAATSTPLGRQASFTGTVPGSSVNTRGLEYYIGAADGFTHAYWPGTSYWGAYATLDGARVATHVVRVLEPPHLVHAPIPTGYYAAPIVVTAQSNCATGTCVATLQWRTTGQEWHDVVMASTRGPQTDIGELWTYTATIPGTYATTQGIDYRMSVTDSYVTDGTPTYHLTVLAPTAVVHAPVLTALPGKPLPIEAVVPCSTTSCTVVLSSRTPATTLLGDPAWTRSAMTLTSPATALANVTKVGRYLATIPAAEVTTRGVEYYIHAYDGHTNAYSPGTMYAATSAAYIDGTLVHYHSVHVAEPIRIVHQPVVQTDTGDPIDIVARVNCATRTCAGVLSYRTPALATAGDLQAYILGGAPFTKQTMTGTVIADLGDAGTVIEYRGRIPGESTRGDGVDYSLRFTDGKTTAFYPGTSYLSPAGSMDGQGVAWQHVVTRVRTAASVGDRVFVDTNANGVVDPGEDGEPGVTVSLKAAGIDGAFGTLDDLPARTTVSGASGEYNFGQLLPGKYRASIVSSSIPPGAVQVSGAPYREVTVAAGERRADADLGIRFTGSFTGTLILDQDNDGQVDAGEPPVPLVDMELFAPGPDRTAGTGDDVSLGTKRTDSAGHYRFDYLRGAEYDVRPVKLPRGRAIPVPTQFVLAPSQQYARTTLVKIVDSTAVVGATTVSASFPDGVRVEMQTNGGILAGDIKVKVAAYAMANVGDSLVSPAYDFSVPVGSPAFASARITIPYDAERLGGYDPAGLRIYHFDTALGLWVLGGTSQTVDPVAKTVSSTVTHFSIYAVMRLDADGWSKYWASRAMRCVPVQSGVSANPVTVDSVLVLDESGSMADNDPSGLRKTAAKNIVDHLAGLPVTYDNVGVVSFTYGATTRSPLRPVYLSSEVTALKAAIDAVGANGGTDIGVGVRRAISLLSSTSIPNGIARSIVLLTDGQGAYDDALTDEAAAKGIIVHTVGLGASADATLLRRISDATGGKYFAAPDAASLPAVYAEIGQLVHDDGHDTDGDGLSDCEEKNGMLSATGFYDGTPEQDADPFVSDRMITTDPNDPDTDNDGLTDGEEMRGRTMSAPLDLRDYAATLDEYAFLIDAGITKYYAMYADPNSADGDGDELLDHSEATGVTSSDGSRTYTTQPRRYDTDLDGADDYTELLQNTDPTFPDPGELGIPGVPRYTLFQPDRYDAGLPIVPGAYYRIDGLPGRATFNRTVIAYDHDFNCTVHCEAINAEAARRSGGSWCWMPFHSCSSEDERRRDIVHDAVNSQGVFDRDGNIRKEYLELEAYAECTRATHDTGGCQQAAANATDGLSADDVLTEVASLVLNLPGGYRPDDMCPGENTRGGVYEMVDDTTGQVIYTGRTYDFETRASQHARDPRFDTATMREKYYTDDYTTQRALEQQNYNDHWGDVTYQEAQAQGSVNGQRPIAKSRVNYDLFLDLAQAYLELCV